MNGGDNSERGDRGDKSGSGAEAVWKRRRDKDGLRTGLLGSARERDWVVGSQILTHDMCDHERGLCGSADVDVWQSSDSLDPIKPKAVGVIWLNSSLVTFPSTSSSTCNVLD